MTRTYRLTKGDTLALEHGPNGVTLYRDGPEGAAISLSPAEVRWLQVLGLPAILSTLARIEAAPSDSSGESSA